MQLSCRFTQVSLRTFVFGTLARSGVYLLPDGLLGLLSCFFLVIRKFYRFLHQGWTFLAMFSAFEILMVFKKEPAIKRCQVSISEASHQSFLHHIYKSFNLPREQGRPLKDPEGYFQKNWVGVCGPLPKTLTLFMTKICDFPFPIYDLTKNLIPYLWPDPYTVTVNIICVGLLLLVLFSVRSRR